ncbi:S41 family peptidase [Silvibacterium acidisoli]|uniref:S41 family peptidase n=1 Tax=Acidobacteriaceae bacterium ZG23-2 TaxID=2883246 RepID=UPI00406D265E
MPHYARRTVFSLLVFLTACGLAGVLICDRVGAQSEKEESQAHKSLRSFAEVYSVVEQNYAEPLNGDKAIYDGAIPGMLRTLDPHSTFLDPVEYARRLDEQRGEYYGVGIMIGQEDGAITVITPYEGTPSFRAGIRPGDKLVAVDGKSTAGITVDDASAMLKGARGTHVGVTLSREGKDQPFTVDLIRAEISQPSVDLKEEIRPGIGYIHLSQFQETTGREMSDALNSFGPGLKGLIFDMRNNPGGIVVQAVATCDKFLQKGQVVVSQRGRALPEEIFRATHGNGGRNYPIVVLVNRGTASAAEIVSGALQDHDRALIVGETTFGKGLVQSMFPMSDNTALVLTTYHYYTPSGRLIQRSYDGLSLLDYYFDREKPKEDGNREVKLTDSGRTEYGGGGITPDVQLPTPRLNRFQQVMLAHDIFVHFAAHYLANQSITKDFQVDSGVLAEFKSYLSGRSIAWTDQQLAENTDWLRNNIRAGIFSSQFGQLEGARIKTAADPLISKAIDYLPQAASLEQNVEKIEAQKSAPGFGPPTHL